MLGPPTSSFFFFFNDTATTEIYTLSLHDALPISGGFASSGCHQMLDAPPRFERWMMPRPSGAKIGERSEEHTSELQSRLHLVCRLLLEKKKHNNSPTHTVHHTPSPTLPRSPTLTR